VTPSVKPCTKHSSCRCLQGRASVEKERKGQCTSQARVRVLETSTALKEPRLSVWAAVMSSAACDNKPRPRANISTNPSSRVPRVSWPDHPCESYSEFDRSGSPQRNSNVTTRLRNPSSCYSPHQYHAVAEKPPIAHRILLAGGEQPWIRSKVVCHRGDHSSRYFG